MGYSTVIFGVIFLVRKIKKISILYNKVKFELGRCLCYLKKSYLYWLFDIYMYFFKFMEVKIFVLFNIIYKNLII